MATNIIIGFVVVTLLGGILAFLASKSWKIVDVIFLFLVFWAAFFFATLSYRVWEIRSKYLAQAVKLRADVARIEAVNNALERGVNLEIGETTPVVEGVDEELIQMGLVKLRHEVSRITQDRGRVWKNCDHAIQNGRIIVSIPEPNPHNIPEKKILFVFEQGPSKQQQGQQARYLGEFRVTQTGPGQVALAPVNRLTPVEEQRVSQSRGKWRLYESVPVDQHDLLTSMTPAEIQSVFPKASANEYLKDDKPTAADDPEDRKVWFNPDGTVASPGDRQEGAEQRYVRRLRDYHLRFRNLFDSRAENKNQQLRDTTDIEQLKSALAGSEANLKTREIEKTNLQQDLTKFETERDQVAKFLAALTGQKNKLDARISQLITENAQMAAEFTRDQLEAIRRIDAATGGPIDADSGN